MLLRLYYLYEKSPKKLRELRNLAEAYNGQFDEMSVKPKRACGTRWLNHRVRAMTICVDKLPIYLQHLQHLVAVKSADQAKLVGYLRKWQDAKLLFFMCFFIDLLKPVAMLSLSFQASDICIVDALQSIQVCIQSLESMKAKELPLPTVTKLKAELTADGNYRGVQLTNVKAAEESVNSHYDGFIDKVQRSITKRLCDATDLDFLQKSAQVLNTENWPDKASAVQEDDNLIHTVQALMEHFREPLQKGGYETSEILTEWFDMTTYVSTYVPRRGKRYQEIWEQLFLCSRASKWQNVLALIRILFALPISNAAVERMFNRMKRVKSDWRCALGERRLENLLRLSEGPPLTNFSVRPAVCSWLSAKHRRPTAKKHAKSDSVTHETTPSTATSSSTPIEDDEDTASAVSPTLMVDSAGDEPLDLSDWNFIQEEVRNY